MNQPQQMAQYARRIESVLDECLPTPDTRPERLHEAMRYVVLGGGKRVRAFLVYATGTAFDVPLRDLDGAAAALELIHAYSLVHDDLPAMDDDDLRRGKPTCHKAYDEATAILVGDALQALAFETLARSTPSILGCDQRLEMLLVLARASGSVGMVGGQAIDLEAVGHTPDIAALEDMHRRKTGALINAAVRLGALTCPRITPQELEALEAFAYALGLAFQVRDDLLDIESSTEELGKPQGSDLRQNKPTYPSLLGMDAARATLSALHHKALEALSGLRAKTAELAALTDYVVTRQH
jgi:geranylgeranyl pyrophosphate synthase